MDCGFSLKSPRGGGSNEYPQSMSRNMKNIRVFLSVNFQFLEVKFSVYLDRQVCVKATVFRFVRVYCSQGCFFSCIYER